MVIYQKLPISAAVDGNHISYYYMYVQGEGCLESKFRFCRECMGSVEVFAELCSLIQHKSDSARRKVFQPVLTQVLLFEMVGTIENLTDCEVHAVISFRCKGTYDSRHSLLILCKVKKEHYK